MSCCIIMLSMEDNVAGIVEGVLQPVSFSLGAPRQDNITMIKSGDCVRFSEEEKKRLRKKP